MEIAPGSLHSYRNPDVVVGLKTLRTLNHSVTPAYWIAFGPHGPRSLPAPDENKKVAFYTLVGVAVSFVVFAGLRAFAKPPPHTMTREWQEAANERLKVRPTGFVAPMVYCTHTFAAGTKVGSVHWCRVRGIYRPGSSPVSSFKGLIRLVFFVHRGRG